MDDFFLHILLKYIYFFQFISICKPKQGSVKLFHNKRWIWWANILKHQILHCNSI